MTTILYVILPLLLICSFGQVSFSQYQVVAPDTISTNDAFGLALTPDKIDAFRVKSWGGRNRLIILTSQKVNKHWYAPYPTSFTASFRMINDSDPFVSPAGNTLLSIQIGHTLLKILIYG